MATNLNAGLNNGLNPGLRQSISGGVDSLGLFRSASLDLRFADKKTLTDRVSGTNLITFSRASSGTYVGSDGLIKTSPVNLLTYSEQFDQWDAGINTTVSPNVAVAPDGTLTADRVQNGAEGGTFIGNGTVNNGVTYTASVYAKAVTPGTNDKFTLNVGGGTANSSSQFTTTSEWQRFFFTITLSNVVSPSFFINNEGDTFASDIYIWGAQLEEGTTATDYIPTGATISGAPRFDYDPVTGESLGLLIEESRTNLATQSQAFTGAPYSPLNATVADNQATAPNGTATAASFLETTTTGGHNIGRPIASAYLIPVTSGTTYTFTVFVKANGRDFVQITCNTGHVAENPRANYDLATGAIGTVDAGATASIALYPDGWRRVSFTVTAEVTAINFIVSSITSSTAARFESFAGDATKGFYIWGYSVEPGSFPTSYIPTTTSAVTRSPDIATIEGTNFSSWYNQSEGTIFTDISPLAAASGRGYLFSNGSDDQRLGQNTDDVSNFALFMSNGSTTSLSAAASGMPKPIKACLAYKPGSSRGVIDGALKILSTTNNVPDAINQVGIGFQNYAGSPGFLDGHIARLAYFPVRKTDQELIDLTKS